MGIKFWIKYCLLFVLVGVLMGLLGLDKTISSVIVGVLAAIGASAIMIREEREKKRNT